MKLESSKHFVPLPGWIRRYTTGFQAWVPLTGIFVLWLLSGPERTEFQRHVSVIFLCASNLMAAAALRQSARRPDLPLRFASGLRWIAWSLVLTVLGGVYLLVDRHFRPGNKEIFNGSDYFFLLSYPVAIWGLLRMPRAAHPPAGFGRILIDSAVFAVGGGLPLWYLAVKPGLATVAGFGTAALLSYPVAIMAGIVCLNIVLLTRAPVPTRGAFGVLLTAIGISWLADLFFLLDIAEEFMARSSIHWSNLLNAVAAGGYLVAAGKIGADRPARDSSVQSPASGPLPIMTIVIVGAWLLVYITYGRPAPEILPRFLWSLLILFAFLCIREIWMIRVNARWMASTVQRESRARAEVLSLDYLKAVVDSTPDMIWSVDPENFRLQTWNHLMEDYFRESRGISIGSGMSPEDLYPSDPEFARCWRDYYRQALTEHSFSVDNVAFPGARFFSLSLNLLGPGDRPFGISVFGRDITKQMHDEAELRLQSAALEAASNSVVITDPKGTIEWVNPAFTKVTGYSAAEVIGKNPRVLKSGKQPDSYYAEMWRTIASGRIWSGEFVNVRKDGGIFTEEVTISPVRDQAGSIIHFVAVKQDVSSRKLLEKQLFKTQRLEVIGMLASGIAHDLNNVLSPILMGASLLRDDLTDESDRQSAINAMEASAQRGAAVVRQILTFARGVDGERVPVQLRHLMGEVASISEKTFPKNIKLRVAAPRDLWPIVGDASQLDQVVMNLCINARDAMPGGGQLTLAAENVNLDETFASMTSGAKAGPYVCLKVTDTGTGIPPDKYDKIFEPFFTTKELGKGTGLGLATVQGIVRSHGGFVQFTSLVGKGTCFEVYLPATPAAKPPSIGEEPAPPPRMRGETILIVDDDDSIRDVTTNILKRQGYEVLTAPNGEQALVTFMQNRTAIRAVVTDMMMPVMDGPALVRVLRRIDPAIIVVGVTGVGEPTSLNTIEALKLSALLTKPFTADKLLHTLHRVLQVA